MRDREKPSSQLKAGFAAGLADMIAVAGRPGRRSQAARSVPAALESDWRKLGGDLRHAAAKVTVAKR